MKTKLICCVILTAVASLFANAQNPVPTPIPPLVPVTSDETHTGFSVFVKSTLNTSFRNNVQLVSSLTTIIANPNFVSLSDPLKSLVIGTREQLILGINTIKPGTIVLSGS